MTSDILGGKNPRGVPLVPFQIAAGQPASYPIQNEILAKGHIHRFDIKPDIHPGKCLEIVTSEVVEAPAGQMAYVRGIGIRIVRAEMWSGYEDIGATARNAMNFRHGARDVKHVLNYMRHVDTLESITFERPRKII
jgi:hypothetical protein